MDIMSQIYEKAKASLQKIAFPEAEEEKILQAARSSADLDLCRPVLVGTKTSIEDAAKSYSIDISDMEIIDTSDGEYMEKIFVSYESCNSEMSAKAIRRKGKNTLYASLMMQAVDVVDVTFAGMTHTTGDVIWAGQMIIGLKEGITTVSSIGIAEIPGYEGSEGNLLVIGDSAVCANPSVEDLAGIAVSACETAKAVLGWDPRCALVSFSTTGSAENELVDKVRDAVTLAQKIGPEYKIDGEFQLDAAIVPAVAAKKVNRPSEVAGKANIIIWPDLNVGNVGVKLLQQFGKADAYGPLLQGFKKIVCDCSRSAPVSELVGNIAISAVRAQEIKK